MRAILSWVGVEDQDAPVIHEVPSPASGTLRRMDAGTIGRACVQLGAGRAKASDAIDFAVGCDRIAKTGTRVERGQPLLRIHARSDASLEAALRAIERV